MKRDTIIIIFSIIIIGLCGYIIYEKVTYKEPTVCNCLECTCKKSKDINANQKIKVQYFISDYGKTNYHDGRVALTLYSRPNSDGLNYGTFTLTIAYDNEFNSLTGNYDIKDNLILTFKTDDNIDHIFKDELGVDVEYTDANDWRKYSMTYSNEIKIGDIKLYRVNK